MHKTILLTNTGILAALKRLSKSKQEFNYIYIGEEDEKVIGLLRKKGLKELPILGYENGFRKDFCREYIDLIGRSGAMRNSIYWWLTFVSSKNRFASALAGRLFSLYSALDSIKKCDNDLLIVASDNAIASILKEYFENNNIKFTMVERNKINQFIDNFLPFLKSIKSILVFMIRTYKKIFLCRHYIRKDFKSEIRGKSFYIIKSFIYRDSKELVDNHYDVFFGILPGHIKEKKDLILLVEILNNYKKNLQEIRSSELLIIPLEYFISFLDPIKAIWRAMVNRISIKEKARFFDIDASHLINSEIARDYMRGNPFTQYLYYVYIKRLLKIVKVDTFTITHENNPWEKMFIMAIRECSPETKIIGYQHTVIPQASANMFISKYEKNVIPTPDKIITIGRIPKEIMESYGDIDPNRVKVGCGLRFEYLFNLKPQKRTHTGKILVVLEGIFEVYHLVNYIFRELKDCPDYKVKFRTHPVLPWDKIKHMVNYNISLFPHFCLSANSPLKNDLEEADMIIYWGSAAGMEAVMSGRPIIHFDRGDILSYDPLFECPYLKWTAKAGEKGGLKKIIKTIHALDDNEFYSLQKNALGYLKDYFYRVEDERIKEFLN